MTWLAGVVCWVEPAVLNIRAPKPYTRSEMPRLLKLDLRPIAYDSVVEAVADDVAEAIEDDVELAEWRPITPVPVAATPQIAFVDGVERRHTRLSAEDGEGARLPGLLAAYAAGAVWPGREPPICHVVVERRVLLAAGARPPAIRLQAHNGCFEYAPVSRAESEFEGLEAALRGFREEIETQVARALVVDGCELVVIDGRLPPHLDERVVGLIKTPHLLPDVVTKHFEVLCGLGAGQRSPVFVRQRSDRAFFSWFVGLRMPGPVDLALANLALLEMDAPRQEALRMADVTASLLPRYASEPYQDDRAPQNLLPVALLERELRHRLGDSELIRRLLVESFYREAPSWQP